MKQLKPYIGTTLARTESQQKIMQAAKLLFSTKGFPDTTTKEIARHAQCSEALIFKYFGDKMNLYQSMIQDFFKINTEKLNNMPKEVPDSLCDEICHAFDWFYRNYNSKVEGNKLSLALTLQFSSLYDNKDLKRAQKKYMSFRLKVFTQRLLKFQLNGQIDKNYDLEQITNIIRSYALMESLLGEHRKVSAAEINRRGKALAEIISNGVKPKQ
jgi:AcrR family transcriptional regulator